MKSLTHLRGPDRSVFRGVDSAVTIAHPSLRGTISAELEIPWQLGRSTLDMSKKLTGIGKPAFIVGLNIYVAKSVLMAAFTMWFITDVHCPVRLEDVVARDYILPRFRQVVPVPHGENMSTGHVEDMRSSDCHEVCVPSGEASAKATRLSVPGHAAHRRSHRLLDVSMRSKPRRGTSVNGRLRKTDGSLPQLDTASRTVACTFCVPRPSYDPPGNVSAKFQ